MSETPWSEKHEDVEGNLFRSQEWRSEIEPLGGDGSMDRPLPGELGLHQLVGGSGQVRLGFFG